VTLLLFDPFPGPARLAEQTRSAGARARQAASTDHAADVGDGTAGETAAADVVDAASDRS
jgi:hypothetical protein